MRVTTPALALTLIVGSAALGFGAGSVGDGPTVQPAAVATVEAVVDQTPRCIHDDYNDGSQALCYTVNVRTGERVYIDVNDEVVPAP